MGHLFESAGLTVPNSALMNSGGQATFVGSPNQVLSRANAALPSSSQILGTDPLNPTNKVPNLPTIGKPNYQQAAATGPAGTANALSPGLTKAGKLVTLLMSGVQGALAGRAADEQMVAQSGGHRAGGIGTGFQAGYQLPFTRAMMPLELEQKQAETQLAQAGLQTVHTRYGDMPLALAKNLFPQEIRYQTATDVQRMKGQTAEDVQGMKGESAQNVAQINKRFLPVKGVGVYDTQNLDQNGMPSLIPGSAQGVKLTPELAQEWGFPPEMVGQIATPNDILGRQRLAAQFAPTTSTTSDSLGVTSTTTRQKQAPPGSFARFPGQPGYIGGGGRAAGPRAGAGATTGGGARGGSGAANAIVDEIGQYRLNPTVLTRMMTKHPELMAMVQQKYPDWDQTSYNAKNKIAMSYTSGPESKSINAISTALGHAGELGDAIEALGNGRVPILNGIANKLGAAIGNTPVTTFNTIVHRLSPEIAAAYIQGGGGEGERVANAQDFDASLGAQQLRSNLGITVKLLRSKIAAQEQQWNNTYQPRRPQDQFATRFLTPLAQRTLAVWSPQAGGAGGQGNRPPLSSFER